MYNRYIPNGASYSRIVEEEAPTLHPEQTSAGAAEHSPEPPGDSCASETQERTGGLSSLLKKLKLEDLDTGDLLLLLILLFLFLEGDDLELVITLGLLLIMGLGKEKE